MESTRLVCLAGEPIGRTFNLRGDDIIGRSDGASVRLTNEGVSRRHARIIQDPDGYWLEDLGSRNGTLLNGQPVRRRRALCLGDRIQLGAKAVLLFTRNDPADRVLAQRERLEAMSALASGIAHDFSNLLGVVLASLDSLGESDQLGSHESECMDDAREAASQAAALSRRLMALATPSEAEGPSDLTSVIEDMLPLARRTLGPLIDLHLELGDGCFVESDAAELQRMVMNLLVNARDAMPDGGNVTLRVRTKRLQIPPSPVARWVELEVRDEGVGIEADSIPLIFEPFFTTKRRSGGNGLGLAMVSAAVHNRGGNIDVTSKVGEGSSFRIMLPECEDDAIESSGESSQVRSKMAEAPSERTQQPRVLLVDDEPLLVRSMKRLLTPVSLVEHVSSGMEAIQRVGAQPPIDLVLLDLRLPDAEGHMVLLELTDKYPHVPVIICSGRMPIGEERGLVAMGAVGLLSKPVGRDELREAVLRHAVVR